MNIIKILYLLQILSEENTTTSMNSVNFEEDSFVVIEVLLTAKSVIHFASMIPSKHQFILVSCTSLFTQRQKYQNN